MIGSSAEDTATITEFTLSGNGGDGYTLFFGVIGGLPVAPASVTATATGQTTGNVTWTAPSSGETPTGYNVYVDGHKVAGPVTGTSQNISGLECGTSYTVTVRAVTAAGEGPGDSGTLTTDACPPQDVVTAEPGLNSVTVSWEDQPEATGYYVYRNDELLTNLPLGENVNRYTDTTGEPGVTYSYEVIAMLPGGSQSLGTDSAARPAEPIPTLSEWALIVLAAILSLTTIIGVRRRNAG